MLVGSDKIERACDVTLQVDEGVLNMHVSRHVLGLTRKLSLVSAIIAACVVPAVAQTNPGTTQMSPAERAFVTNMLQISRGQIALATLAQQRMNDSSAAVSFDETASEWYAFRSHLATLAAAVGAPSPVALSAAQQAMLAQLQSAPRSRVIGLWVKLERQGDQAALAQIRAQHVAANSPVGQFIAYASPELTTYDQAGYDHVMTAQSVSPMVRAGAYSWK